MSFLRNGSFGNLIFTKKVGSLAPIEVEILAIFLGEIATKSGKMVY
jgi:hypothetical protein